ncbi:MAG: hypothetical protein KatS3mg096_362 [Candidatus Parcubacteria bacterium]|nr:MAG: hypothetical protein KatS3mg096_362 [Candidatus Parcubacteria bacterium]
MRILRSHTTPQFEKDFLSLPKDIRLKAERKIKLFEANCFHPSLRAHKLKGILRDFWSFSINRTYRVIFKFLENNEVIYYRIGRHDIYQQLEKLV